VNEDGPRQGQRIKAVKRIIGKQNPALLSSLKVAQAVAARTVSGGDFGMSGMAVTGRAHRGPDEIGDFGWNGGDAEGMWHEPLASNDPTRFAESTNRCYPKLAAKLKS
jgi:hypothetical protein